MMMTASTPSMSCAGLLGLAVGYGIQVVLHTDLGRKQNGRTPVRDANRDFAITRGLNYLGRVMEPALRGGANDEQPNLPGPGRGFRGRRGFGRGEMRGPPGSDYYFLWSLERVAMVYGLKTIGNKDWFAIGSKFIVQEQQGDGAWRGDLGEIVDTCFALFFLRRANLAVDLTATLKGKVRDPGVVNLRAGEVAGARGQRKDSSPGGAEEKPKLTEPTARARPKLEAPKEGAQPSRKESPKPVPSAESSPGDSQVADANRLRDQLVRASLPEQKRLLEQLRDSKGTANTDALASAIPLLKGTAKTGARDALAQRLARMTSATLREKLHEPDSELRRAAALACAMKEEKTLIPDLIGLLDQSESRVARAAHASLKALTGQDLGPSDESSKEEKTKAVVQWRQWWAKNGGKQ
jgi:hypothetical protein